MKFRIARNRKGTLFNVKMLVLNGVCISSDSYTKMNMGTHEIIHVLNRLVPTCGFTGTVISHWEKWDNVKTIETAF